MIPQTFDRDYLIATMNCDDHCSRSLELSKVSEHWPEPRNVG